MKTAGPGSGEECQRNCSIGTQAEHKNIILMHTATEYSYFMPSDVNEEQITQTTVNNYTPGRKVQSVNRMFRDNYKIIRCNNFLNRYAVV